jgi:hypothetical protein
MGKSVPYNRHSTTDETQRAQRCLGVRIGKDYLNKKQTTKIIKWEVDDFEYIKIENFSIPKDNIKEVKIQPTNSKVVFGISVTDKAVSIPDIG